MMGISSEDKYLIKSLPENKKYGTKQLLKLFPNKNWSHDGLKAVIKKLTTQLLCLHCISSFFLPMFQSGCTKKGWAQWVTLWLLSLLYSVIHCWFATCCRRGLFGSFGRSGSLPGSNVNYYRNFGSTRWAARSFGSTETRFPIAWSVCPVGRWIRDEERNLTTMRSFGLQKEKVIQHRTLRSNFSKKCKGVVFETRGVVD